ncbi:molybdopterin-dependent oxidoreductase, partial [Salmonella enterica subsp. enterica serovar Montevideo]|nr:molybdopterin-dependent oxidoreductase [Salmonella enterica subsp. enterica serovar Montevideo]
MSVTRCCSSSATATIPLQLALAHTLYSEKLYDKNFLDNYCVGFDQFLPYLLGEKDG